MTYKKQIRRIAKEIFRGSPSDNLVEVRLDYFHTGHRRVDMDNVAKCVLDSLNGLAYYDDKQVRLQSATAYSLSSVVSINGGPVDLIKPLSQFKEYLFIRIRTSSLQKY